MLTIISNKVSYSAGYFMRSFAPHARQISDWANFTYLQHRHIVEQRILHDHKLFNVITNKYTNMLFATQEWQKKYILPRRQGNRITIFQTYSNAIADSFPEEKCIGPWVHFLTADLRLAGFDSKFDKLDAGFAAAPIKFMMDGIEKSDFIMAHGSSSLMSKYKTKCESYIVEELELTLRRMTQDQQRNKNMSVFALKIFGRSVKDAFPPRMLNGSIHVFEFVDAEGNINGTYITVMQELMKAMFQEYCISQTELRELKNAWKKALDGFPEGLLPLTKFSFDSIVSQFQDQTRKQELLVKAYLTCIFNTHKSRPDRLDFDAPEMQPVDALPSAAKFRFGANDHISKLFGREEESRYLDQSLLPHDKNDPVIIVLHGLPGVGKNHLAQSWQRTNADKFNFIAIINAESIETLNEDYIALSIRLDLVKDEKHANLNILVVRDKIKDYLSSCKKWLLIFKNAQDEKQLSPYIPTGNGCVAITSDNPSGFPEHLKLEIKGLTDTSATLFLEKLTGRSNDKKYLKALALSLGNVPLALRQAGNYLGTSYVYIPTEKFIAELEQSRTLLDIMSLTLPKHVPRGIFALWETLLDKMKQNPEGKIAIQLLAVCAYLSSDIPLNLIDTILSKGYPGATDQLVRNIIMLLMQHSALSPSSKGSGYLSINVLMQKFLMARYDLDFDKKTLTLYETKVNAHCVLHSLILSAVADPDRMSIYVKDFDLLPHAEKFLTHVSRIKTNHLPLEDKEMLARLSYLTAQMFSYKSDYKKSLAWYVKANEILNKSDHAFMSLIEHGMGQVYLAQHRNFQDYQNAEQHLDKALTTLNHHPIEHKAAILNDLGRLYYDMGKYEQSREKCQEVINICLEHNLSEISYAYVSHDLGMANQMLAYTDEAEICFKRALEIKTRIYGDRAVPTIAATQLSIGQVKYNKGLYKDALQYFNSSLAVSQTCFSEEAYPNSHPGIAAAFNDIGSAQYKLGLYVLALKNYISALRLYSNFSGDKSVDVAIVLHNIAIIALLTANQSFFRLFIEKAYRACIACVGSDHKISHEIKKTKILVNTAQIMEASPVDFEVALLKLSGDVASIADSVVTDHRIINPLLSNRYGFFRATPHNVIPSHHPSGELNLTLSNS